MPKDSAAAEHRNGLPTAESLIEQSTETNVKLELGDLLAASHGEKSSLKKGGASSKADAKGGPGGPSSPMSRPRGHAVRRRPGAQTANQQKR